MKRVFVIHGWKGSPENHWFPWLQEQLTSNGLQTHLVHLPSPATPKVREWIAAIREAVGTPNKETYFVGHSLGCIAIIRYLESLPEEARVGGCVFVAGFSKGVSIPELREFKEGTINVDKVRAHTNKLVTIFSTNDDVVTMEEGVYFQTLLKAKIIIEKTKDISVRRMV